MIIQGWRNLKNAKTTKCTVWWNLLCEKKTTWVFGGLCELYVLFFTYLDHLLNITVWLTLFFVFQWF
jgi:hypothetical protein